MRRFKGDISIFFIIALALLIVLAFFVVSYTQKASLVSYDERINLALVLDNTGSGLLDFLNSGEAGMKHIEVLGGSVANHVPDSGITESLGNLKTGMGQKGYSLKVLVSEGEISDYGGEPPEEAAVVEADIPLPCTGGNSCKGRVKMGIW